MKNECPNDMEKERTKEFNQFFNIRKCEELTKLYRKSDAFLLTCVFEIFIEVSTIEFNINPPYSVSLPGYTWQCG